MATPPNAHGGYLPDPDTGEVGIDPCIDPSVLLPGSRRITNLSLAYKAYKLDTITGVKLYSRTDGTIHPEDLKAYHKNFTLNWKTQEGGVLYCGILSQASRNFFGREAGCMDKKCPFLHDRDAVLTNRAQVLATRRATFNSKITLKQRFARERMRIHIDHRALFALSTTQST
ncbi:hypothetical protein PILCRDRAFT_87369 [Piloderma croceum F 1598]|uniref:Uncharacterized protein n=1 Tax=Piloderma croceum (strain F 1598) TaxID=765440 RepID=A0A0C3FM43_PILCF|nr:hypothetical protein PILCRDRAFT_87369 [Piloderma croceum F 1598]